MMSKKTGRLSFVNVTHVTTVHPVSVGSVQNDIFSSRWPRRYELWCSLT
jgi:hypothetical protein